MAHYRGIRCGLTYDGSDYESGMELALVSDSGNRRHGHTDYGEKIRCQTWSENLFRQDFVSDMACGRHYRCCRYNCLSRFSVCRHKSMESHVHIRACRRSLCGNRTGPDSPGKITDNRRFMRGCHRTLHCLLSDMRDTPLCLLVHAGVYAFIRLHDAHTRLYHQS